MEISFANRRLQRLCESFRAIQKAHGKACAKKLASRRADLEAAGTLEVMGNLPGNCHELNGDRDGQLAVDLTGGKRLIFRPSSNPPPQKADGGLDWTRVESVELIDVCDYHD